VATASRAPAANPVILRTGLVTAVATVWTVFSAPLVAPTAVFMISSTRASSRLTPSTVVWALLRIGTTSSVIRVSDEPRRWKTPAIRRNRYESPSPVTIRKMESASLSTSDQST
jgi:hypothetical protein